MRLSDYKFRTLKNISEEEKSTNARLLIRWWFIDQTMSWVFNYLPLWLKVIKKIERIIREEIDSIWWQEILMSSLHPKDNWEITWRYDQYDALFKFKSFFWWIDYVLWPTHEEIISPLMKKHIISHKDLPTYIYQIQNKFRDEKRAKSWILRWREFFMKDLYSFHKDEKDLDEYYELVKKSYVNIFNKVWIWKKTFLTYASWWTFSKYSHEFQTITNAWEDNIYICDKCKIGINDEIITEQNICPECWNNNLKKDKSIEVWNIFKLKTRFSEPFKLFYTNVEWNSNPVIMWCYWIWIWRLMWTIVEVSHDDKWIIWPENIAPYKYVIVPIWKDLLKKADQIYNYLNKKWIEVILDDRNVSMWFKLNDSDLIWYPYKIVISDKTQALWDNIVEMISRKNWESVICDYKKIV